MGKLWWPDAVTDGWMICLTLGLAVHRAVTLGGAATVRDGDHCLATIRPRPVIHRRIDSSSRALAEECDRLG